MKRTLSRILNRLGLLRYLNLSIPFNGLHIPIINGIGYPNVHPTENWLAQVLTRLLKETKGCFVDVGMNIGQTLLKVKSIDRNIDYVGFEPNPVCVFYVEQLISCNSFPNTTIIPTGISSSNDVITLKILFNDLSDSHGTIIENFRPDDGPTQEKNIVVLNSEVINLEKKIGIVKIDVEGAELEVIKGLEKFIRRDRPAIIMEILPVYSEKNEDRFNRQNNLMELMRSMDYGLLRIMKNADNSLDGFTRLQKIEIHDRMEFCDYLWVPVEDMKRFATESLQHDAVPVIS